MSEIREFMRSAWITALSSALASALPASCELHVTEEVNHGSDESQSGAWSWYSQCLSRSADQPIWAGASTEGWSTLVNSLLMAPGDAASPESIDSTCMDILAAANGLWAEELRQRFGRPFDFGGVARTGQPDGIQLIVVSIDSPLLPYSIKIAAGFAESLIGYLSNLSPGGSDSASPRNLPNAISDLRLDLYALLGRITLPIGRVLNLKIGSVLDIGRSAADLVDLVANGKTIASGQVVAVKGSYAIKVSKMAPR